MDLLQCHVRSTGLMFEKHVAVPHISSSMHPQNATSLSSSDASEMVFRVVDVGGHRNERKKWSYVLGQENDAIIFVVSAASFCQVLFEDFKKNAMRESVSVWVDIVAGLDSEHSSAELVLVINKMDLFEQRWASFGEYFPEFTGAMTKDGVLAYIKELYLGHTRGKRTVHTVCTQLTDVGEITRCDGDVRLIRDQLQSDQGLYRDIADTVIEYAFGDVFWSESWLRPMWRRKQMKMRMAEHEWTHPTHPTDPQFSMTRNCSVTPSTEIVETRTESGTSHTSTELARIPSILEMELSIPNLSSTASTCTIDSIGSSSAGVAAGTASASVSALHVQQLQIAGVGMLGCECRMTAAAADSQRWSKGRMARMRGGMSRMGMSKLSRMSRMSSGSQSVNSVSSAGSETEPSSRRGSDFMGSGIGGRITRQMSRFNLI